jgi:hypothetical protein
MVSPHEVPRETYHGSVALESGCDLTTFISKADSNWHVCEPDDPSLKREPQDSICVFSRYSLSYTHKSECIR